MKKIAAAFFLLALLTSCDGGKDKIVTIKTSLGDMTVILYDETPLHKANFIKLAESGEYDSTIFHRVMQEFMIQGGGIDMKKGNETPDTTRVNAEIIEGFYHKKGELAAARQPDQVNPAKRSSYCQFYIVHGRVWSELELTTDQNKLNQGLGQLIQLGGYDSLQQQFAQLQMEGKYEEMNQLFIAQRPLVEEVFGVDLSKEISKERLDLYTTAGGAPHLDGEYTIFGRVVEGLDVIDKIAKVPVGEGNNPMEAVYISMEVKKMSKKEITEKYGYTYPKK